ncbi:hypothetical protein EVAR_59276_1 [Eumeta japonica]|uniref:Uncharacterized protein n=1 Tax=Eumeta variegata TaxID=151549 RepID=A0A4C1YNV5_EUMVA|nr:hypothetical protein EVAR_59276_1 [Eumeta japonica]
MKEEYNRTIGLRPSPRPSMPFNLSILRGLQKKKNDERSQSDAQASINSDRLRRARRRGDVPMAVVGLGLYTADTPRREAPFS